jgi:hypothetical protein
MVDITSSIEAEASMGSLLESFRLRSKVWLRTWGVVAALFVGALLVGAILYAIRDIDRETFLNYFALGLLIFVFVTLFYGIIAIHDVPYEIAKHRDHPHQDAIHAAGWVSLFTLHAIWPFLWIWAMLYRPERGWGLKDPGGGERERAAASEAIQKLERRVALLERRRERSDS